MIVCAFFDEEFMGRLNEIIKSAFWQIEDEGFEILHKRSVKPFENAELPFRDQRVVETVKYHNEKWFHNEIVVKAKNATVEPQYAYAIDGLRTIIGASIRTRENLPSPIPMIKAKFLGKKKSLKKAILFDGTMGGNYNHFYADVFHKMYVLPEFTELDCPILVGPAIWEKSMMKFIRNDSPYKNLDWQLITEPVEAEELWVSRPMPFDKNHWLKTKQIFIKEDIPITEKKAIFLNRVNTTRTILNFDEIEKILTKHGVEVFVPEKLSMAEQAAAFNTTTHVISIHGAALTNLMYCNHSKTKVLELCSNNRIGTQFYWLSTALGMEWDMMLGSEADSNQSFTLDASAFEERLIEFLA